MPERRDFLLKTVKSMGLATIGGLVWSSFIEESRSAPLILRPPGALEENDFLSTCTKCGMCVEACPYDTLTLATPGSGRPVGTPFFIPRNTPCHMCKDIPCVDACPSSALNKSLVSEQDEKGEPVFNVNLSQMGLAVIDRETCIAYSGIQCDACYRACPLSDKAITVEYTRIERTGKHVMLAPVIHSVSCTGCGKCENSCVTQKASVFVLPRSLALGESNIRYVKGWDQRDEERLKDLPETVTTETPRSSKNPLDYLNEDSL